MDNLTGTALNDTFNADHTQLSASDTIKGGDGKDTFNYTDAGTTGGNVPAALVSGVEVVNIRNVNGTAAVAATNEKATFTFGAVADTQTVTITPAGGVAVTYSNTTGGAVTGDVVAAYFAANLPAGYSFTSMNGAQLVLTATAAGDAANLTIGGSAAATQSVVLVQGTAAVASNGVTDTVAAGNFAGATEFNSVNSTNGVTFTGLATGTAVGLVGNGSVNNGALSFAYATATDAVTLNIANGTKSNAGSAAISNTGTGATAVTINSTGAANTVATVALAATNTVKALTINADANLTTGTVSGLGTDAAVTVKGAAASVNVGTLTNAKTIDASGLAGGLTVGLDTVTTSFKGGAGNDVITSAAVATTSSIDAGAGTDTLVIAAATDVDSATKGAVYKGVDIVRTANNQDMSVFTATTVTAIQMEAATSKTLSNVTAAQAAALTVRGDQTTAFTVTLANAAGTADVVNMTLSNNTATAAVPADVDVAGLSVIGVETLNITSSGGDVALTGGTQVNSLTFAANGADKLTAITVSGASALDLNLGNTDKAVTVTSTQTGSAALKVAGNVVKGSSITTTANVDDITVTAQAAGVAGDFITYNAGAGNDAISATAAALNNVSNSFASVKIEGGEGTDTLTFSETALTLVDANFQYVTGVERIANSTTGTLSISTGGFFDTNFKGTGATFVLGETTTGAARTLDASSFTGKATVTVSNNGAANISTVKTGAGDDVITLTQGTTSNTGTDVHVIQSGQGNDTIVAKNSLVSVTGGRGADVIDIADATNDSDVIVVAAGDSTAAGRDKVTGFQAVATTGDKLDLAGTFSLQAAVTAADGTDSGVVKSHSITSGGIITFDDINAYDTALVINSSNLADALAYAIANFTTAGKTVGFAYDSDNNGSNDATIVFQADADAASNTVVELVGVTGVTTLAATAGANTVVII